jgi:glycine hydroxymethyltransferase
VNFSGKLFRGVHYTVDRETEQIDFAQLRALALEHRPRVIVSGFSAYPRAIDFAKFAEVAAEVGAVHLCDMAHIAGLVAAGVHPSPVPHAGVITTTTHKTLRGPRGGAILCRETHAKAVDKAVFPGMQGGPLMHVIAAKAQAFYEAMQPDFEAYQRQVAANARALAAALQERGFRLVAGGTDNHLMLVDLTPKGVTGAEAETHLESVGITTNKNTIPFDTQPPAVTSGLRLGTPALTSRGMVEPQMEEIATLIAEVIENLGKRTEKAAKQEVIQRVYQLCEAYPIYRALNYAGA